MVPNTEEARIWKPLVSRLMWSVITLLVLVGALVYTNIRTNTALTQSRHATASANAATMRANHAIACLNATLGSRAPETAADNAAELSFLAAEKADATAFGGLLTDILVSAPATKSTPDFLAYIKVHTALINTANAAYKTLQSDQAYRAAHPLGLC